MNMKTTGHVVIHEDANRHLAFVGQCKNRAGHLLVVFREGAGHVDPEGRILLTRSADGGRTWSKPTCVVDTDLDDRDPSIAALPSGRLILNYFSSRCTKPWDEARAQRWGGLCLELGRKNWDATVDHVGLVYSDDDGETWSREIVVTRAGLATSEPVCVRQDGHLLLPVYGKLEGEEFRGSKIFHSSDNGETWDGPHVIATDVSGIVGFEEPSLAQLPDGRLLCHMRSSSSKVDPGAVWQCESADGGRTWSTPAKLPLWGYPQSLTRLDHGRVLSVYGYRRYPPGVRAAVSRDGGRTWDPNDEIVIRHDGVHHDLGYPAAVALPNGQAFVAYYINTGKAL
ncbi:MAG: exo-alpha-sialidase, partial [Planctomycetes bacterium]|nr:exo-alpha-sialidase [Planctomycetota bacterium]